MYKQTGVLLKSFNFKQEQVEVFQSLNSPTKTYEFDLITPSFIPNGQFEGLLQFEFTLRILPDVGTIFLSGDCIVYSTTIKALIFILSSKDKKVKEMNKNNIKAFNLMIVKKCLDQSKEIGEKKGIIFHNYDMFLEEIGVKNITYRKNSPSKTIKFDGDKFIKTSKLLEKPITVKDFEYYEESITTGKNRNNKVKNATYDVKVQLLKPEIVYINVLKVKYHFEFGFYPDICYITFNGHFMIYTTKRDEIFTKMIRKEVKTLDIINKIIRVNAITHAGEIAKTKGIPINTHYILGDLGLI